MISVKNLMPNLALADGWAGWPKLSSFGWAEKVFTR
jgi:hypothetical protein